MQRKRKSCKSESHSTLSLLRRELREGTLQSLFGASSFIVSSPSAAPDPLLSSFIIPMNDDLSSSPSQILNETGSDKKILDEKVMERNVQSTPLSVKDREERAKRSEFVHGLLLSTILDGDL
ncbi:hypothetical protein SAY87_003522 [Trapa incisa]|uniref:Di19 C-terminal domain-containing protein n=1 Tax=Trapa incisa TaxID=236973 RepID=A0AAN7KRD5_9MYRT|nr:hypothetical protein SAY87_003522 [Trapa incisa]